jgi:outer membrane protein TolC
MARVVGLLTSLCLGAFSGHGLTQSLQQAVQKSLADYPSVSAAHFQGQAANADVARARSAHWPQLSWTARYASHIAAGMQERWFQTPELRLNLWSGGRISADVDRAQAIARASQKKHHITRDEVALLSSEAYWQWAYQRDMLALALRNLDAHQRIMSDFERIAQVDTGRRIDLDQARVRHDNAQLIWLRSQTEMDTAAQYLTRMLMAPVPAEPTGLDMALPSPYADLTQAQHELNDQHPVLAQWLAQRDAAEANVRFARAQKSPTLNLLHNRMSSPGLDDVRFVTQLQLSLPLVDGGNAHWAEVAAQARVQDIESQLQEARLLLNEQLVSAWNDWQSAKTRAVLGDQQTLTAQALAAGYAQQFRVGRRALLDLLNIQSDLYTYQSAALTAKHQARTAQARVLATLGQLANAFASIPDTPITPK